MAVATNLELTRLVASIGIARRVARRAEACPGATRTRERSSARLTRAILIRVLALKLERQLAALARRSARRRSRRSRSWLSR